jgi:hypothetical protein
MKKIVLLPKTDTVTLCLPAEWVCIPIICKLEPIHSRNINYDDAETEAQRMVVFLNKKRRKRINKNS